jgi:hypothetical protein
MKFQLANACRDSLGRLGKLNLLPERNNFALAYIGRQRTH